MEIHDKKVARFRFLEHLYATTDGDEMKTCKQDELGEELGFTRSVTQQITQYLYSEGLIKRDGIGGWVSLTHMGVVEIEQAHGEPDTPTEHFPAYNVINVGTMAGGVIQQQGGSGNTQNMQIGAGSVEQLKNLEGALRAALPRLELNEEMRAALAADIETMSSQLGSPSPKRPILGEVLRSIRSIVEGVAGSVIAQELLPQIIAAMAALGL